MSYMIKHLQSIELHDLAKCIQEISKANPYQNKDEALMWDEQCFVNFPLLYMASIYLYNYAKERKCDTFLFATRDCCHWFKIFSKIYPNAKSHYFHCSRNMFEGGARNVAFKKYVESIAPNIDTTIFVDIHGTGRRMFQYFSSEFSKVPYCFLLSATFRNYGQFPKITQAYHKEGKFMNLIFDARGSPIEMLNYDTIGTLQNYAPAGPIRDQLEYKVSLIEPYHASIRSLVNKITPINASKPIKIETIYDAIKKLSKSILDDKPVISKHIKHVANHAKNSNNASILDEVTFEEILSRDTTYGVIWSGLYNEQPCVIKMVMLKGTNNKKDEKMPFYHSEFKTKKMMSDKDFTYEADQLALLSNTGMAPKFHGYTRQKGYGFIVMQRMDCSLKDVLLTRSLKSSEKDIVEKMINKLHDTAVHGDLKPSNIGVQLDKDGKVQEACVFDCQKVKQKKGYKSREFNALKNKDLRTYRKHTKKNRNE